MHRVEFDSTIDELVDANVTLVQRTATYHRQRSRYQWFIAVCTAGGLLGGLLNAYASPSYFTIVLASSGALLVGLAGGMLYGRYHDWHVRRGYRRVVDEMFRGAKTIHCEFELRDDGLWSRSPHAEVSFPWPRLTRVEDVPGSISLWFDPGLAIIRDRAFHTADEREAFLAAVRQRLR